MISTQKLLTDHRFLSDKRVNVERKPKLVAHWQKVDSQLICRWIIA